MNMKATLNKKMSTRIFNRAPINFWDPPKREEDSTTKTSYEDHICHEVKYDPSDKDSETKKEHIKPFSFGTAEQWLKFMEDLNVVIHGNGLNNNSMAHFNLTCSSLKGEALCIFNAKAEEQKEKTRDTHAQCLRPITEHVFPKENLHHKQKTFMCNHVFLHLSDKTIRGGSNSIIILMSFCHLDPINASQRTRPRTSSLTLFPTIGSLTCSMTSLTSINVLSKISLT
jgi:hypothetical protein